MRGVYAGRLSVLLARTAARPEVKVYPLGR